VSWKGTPGPGASSIAAYTIFVSDDGGPFAAFLTNTSQTSATFTGQVGHIYGFYSVATDNLGFVQPPPATAQAVIAVNAPPPPPLVTMTAVRPVTNKKHLVTEIIVTFSGTVNAGEADSLTTYRLVAAGKHGSFTARNANVIKLKSAVYNAASHSVTLTPMRPFKLAKPVQLQVIGVPPSGLQDSSGRFIDGNHVGQPGGDAVAVLSRAGTVVNALVDSSGDLRSAARRGQETRAEQRVSRFRLPEPSAVDHLLERENAVAVKSAVRAQRPFRDDAVKAMHQRRAGRDEHELVAQMAQVRVEWKPPLPPWTEWTTAGTDSPCPSSQVRVVPGISPLRVPDCPAPAGGATARRNGGSGTDPRERCSIAGSGICGKGPRATPLDHPRHI
jgi:hypothetical protein